MSTSHCLIQALDIARQPVDAWKAAIEDIPEACTRPDCTGGIGCRERVADYLRVQWRMLQKRPQVGAQ